MINTNLEEARHIKEVFLEDLLASSVVREEGPRKIDKFDLDVCEDKVRPVPEGDFEVVLLDDNPLRSVKIGFGLPLWGKVHINQMSPGKHISFRYLSTRDSRHRPRDSLPQVKCQPRCSVRLPSKKEAIPRES